MSFHLFLMILAIVLCLLAALNVPSRVGLFPLGVMCALIAITFF